jgi:hypothetical protein
LSALSTSRLYPQEIFLALISVDWLQAGSLGDRIPVGARFSAPVQTGPESHPASCTMGTESFPGVKERPGSNVDPSPPSSDVVIKE